MGLYTDHPLVLLNNHEAPIEARYQVTLREMREICELMLATYGTDETEQAGLRTLERCYEVFHAKVAMRMQRDRMASEGGAHVIQPPMVAQ